VVFHVKHGPAISQSPLDASIGFTRKVDAKCADHYGAPVKFCPPEMVSLMRYRNASVFGNDCHLKQEWTYGH
jgi:hypothetical protein